MNQIGASTLSTWAVLTSPTGVLPIVGKTYASMVARHCFRWLAMDSCFSRCASA